MILINSKLFNINIYIFKDQYKTQETCDLSISEDYSVEPHSPPNIDSEKITTKKNKTVMSKLKKKALYLSNIFSPGLILYYKIL